MTESKKVCVILGAGASHDVRSDASPITNAKLQPPLAGNLFNAENSDFWEILNSYSGARFLAQNLITDVANGTGLEDALTHYAFHPTSEQLRQRFKHIPPYLRDLLWRCSGGYTPVPSGYVRLVTELLAEHPHEVLFIVMNYDDLLERALASFDRSYTFDKLPYYVAQHRSAKVVKLHGSIDWFRPMSGRDSSWDECVERLNTQIPYQDIQVINHGTSTRDNKVSKEIWGLDYDPWVYPVLTAPLAGKGLADAVCPGAHQSFAREFLATCAKVLVIGTSGMDDDLLDLLDSSINVESTKLIHFVGKGDGTNAALTGFQNGVSVFRESSRINQFTQGFQKYINGPEFKTFAADSLY